MCLMPSMMALHIYCTAIGNQIGNRVPLPACAPLASALLAASGVHLTGTGAMIAMPLGHITCTLSVNIYSSLSRSMNAMACIPKMRCAKRPSTPHFDLTSQPVMARHASPSAMLDSRGGAARASSGAVSGPPVLVNPSPPLDILPPQGLSRSVSDPLPPLFNKATRLTIVEDGVWQYEQDFAVKEVGVRGWALRLQDGTFLVSERLQYRPS